MYALRWLWYLPRLALYTTVSFLRFISRQNVRVMIVLAIIGMVFLLRDWLHPFLARELHRLDPGYQPEGFILDVGVVIFGVMAVIAYCIVSALLIFLLSLFRLGLRPTRPQRKLQATKTNVTTAVVRIVVPPLVTPEKRRRWR